MFYSIVFVLCIMAWQFYKFEKTSTKHINSLILDNHELKLKVSELTKSVEELENDRDQINKRLDSLEKSVF